MDEHGIDDLSRPFENTPAQNWAEGIAGLTVPPATKVGAFSNEQVASKLEQVKQAIVVSSLDPEVLQRHNVEKYTALLAPDAAGRSTALATSSRSCGCRRTTW